MQWNHLKQQRPHSDESLRSRSHPDNYHRYCSKHKMTPSHTCARCRRQYTSRLRTGPDGFRTLCCPCEKMYRDGTMVVYENATGKRSSVQFPGSHPFKIVGFKRDRRNLRQMRFPITRPLNLGTSDSEKKRKIPSPSPSLNPSSSSNPSSSFSPSQSPNPNPCLKKVSPDFLMQRYESRTPRFGSPDQWTQFNTSRNIGESKGLSNKTSCLICGRKGGHPGPDGKGSLCPFCNVMYGNQKLPLYRKQDGSITVVQQENVERVKHVGFMSDGVGRDFTRPNVAVWMENIGERHPSRIKSMDYSTHVADNYMSMMAKSDYRRGELEYLDHMNTKIRSTGPNPHGGNISQAIGGQEAGASRVADSNPSREKCGIHKAHNDQYENTKTGDLKNRKICKDPMLAVQDGQNHSRSDDDDSDDDGDNSTCNDEIKKEPSFVTDHSPREKADGEHQDHSLMEKADTELQKKVEVDTYREDGNEASCMMNCNCIDCFHEKRSPTMQTHKVALGLGAEVMEEAEHRLSIKIVRNWNGNRVIKRFKVEKDMSGKQFKDEVGWRFGLKEDFSITYKDEENDLVTATSNDEIAELFSIACELKVKPVRMEIVIFPRG